MIIKVLEKRKRRSNTSVIFQINDGKSEYITEKLYNGSDLKDEDLIKDYETYLKKIENSKVDEEKEKKEIIVNEITNLIPVEDKDHVNVLLSNMEASLINKKRKFKIDAITQIKIQTSPTVDSIIDALKDYDKDFIKFILKIYIQESYSRGYIESPTWENFINDIKETSVDELKERV